MSKTKTVAKTTPRNINLRKNAAPKAETKPVSTAKKGLFFFQMTPSGKLLRAYFTGLIVAQCGGVKPNSTFRLWPNANVKGHIESKRLKKIEGSKGCFQLTAAGVNYLTDANNAADKAQVAAMAEAVKTGKRPAFYNYEMSPL